MFHEILVIDYITDFKNLTPDDINKLSKDLLDSQFLLNCPCGTIIGRPISGDSHNQKKVYYPFFSHINMPIKAGERAWTFERKAHQVSYWVSRKVQNTSAEDLNFTHDDRAATYPHINSSEELIEANSKKFIDLKNSVVSLEKTRKEAFARKEFVGEPTVFSKSKSIDLTLQGSNGTVINLTNLGIEKTATIELTAGVAIPDDQKIVTNTDEYNESVKPSLVHSSSKDDSSKIVISQNFDADQFFSIAGDQVGRQNTVAIKTEGVRIIAENDLKIIVGNSDDPSSIIMKSNGDIVITPSRMGIIKLGGEDATGAILATEESVVTAGRVLAPSIVSTAGGIIGAPDIPGTGLFSTKVLVKVN